jgi:branched-chain amino acid transport system permease protein
MDWKRFAQNLGILLAGSIVLYVLNGILEQSINKYYLQIINKAGIFIILAVSLNLINGFTGQFSLGHAGFMAVGGYSAATLTEYFGVPLVPSLLFAGLVAALGGLLVGLPTLRLRGDYLAIATLGFGEIIRVVLLNIPEQRILGRDVDLGAARGFSGINDMANFFWIYLFALITIMVIVNIVNSSQGRAFKSIREDELAAEVMGVNTTYYKVAAFVIGSFFAGVAGGLYAHEFLILHPARFNFMLSVEIVVMVVLGGMGSTSGVILAAIFLTILPEWLRDVSKSLGEQIGRPELDLRMVIYSLLLIILMLVRPQGLMGTREFSFGPARGRFKPQSDQSQAIASAKMGDKQGME